MFYVTNNNSTLGDYLFHKTKNIIQSKHSQVNLKILNSFQQ
jgi:hypothetical protein